MRISDWSSDVCSSDLAGDRFGGLARGTAAQAHAYAIELLQLTRARDITFEQRQQRGSEGFRSRLLLRSEEHTSELQSLMRISYAVFCLKKKKIYNKRVQYKCN